MSKDEHPSIFLPQMEAIVFIIHQFFFATHTVLKIREYSQILPSFSWEKILSCDAFRTIACKGKYLMEYILEHFPALAREYLLT